MEMSVVDIIIKVISQLGFPIFVAVWLLIRTDRILRDLKDAVNALCDCIKNQNRGCLNGGSETTATQHYPRHAHRGRR